MSIVKKNIIQKIVLKLLPHRLLVQASFLLIWLDPLSLRLHTMCSPVFHCYACPLATFGCPIGIIAQFSALHIIPFVAIGLLITTAALLGSLICGWICPFGLLQDLAAKVPTPKLKIPKPLGYFRYVVLLATVIILPYFFGEQHPLFICRICPAGGLEKALPDMVSAAVKGQQIPWPNAIKMTIIITFLIAIFFSVRPWCRIFCPLGAIFGFFNRFSVFSMQLNEEHCTKCNRCRTLCKYGINPDENPNDDSCIRCLECSKCSPSALKASTIFSQDPKPKQNKPKNPQ